MFIDLYTVVIEIKVINTVVFYLGKQTSYVKASNNNIYNNSINSNIVYKQNI